MVANTQNTANSNNAGKKSDNEDNLLKISLVNQSVFIRKRRRCPLEHLPIAEINYKNLDLLNKFLTERGKIIPSRVTNVSMKKQRALGQAIKRARQLALLSPIEKQDQ
jgi:small subunit ribosomal protein S18